MNNFQINNVINLSAEERYCYFVRKVADFEMVWGLYNEGWAVASDDYGNEILPFWPEQEFAKICAVGFWNNYVAISIPLNDFIKNWLSGMERDRKAVGVFYIPSGTGIITEPSKLRSEIEDEIRQYE